MEEQPKVKLLNEDVSKKIKNRQNKIKYFLFYIDFYMDVQNNTKKYIQDKQI